MEEDMQLSSIRPVDFLGEQAVLAQTDELEMILMPAWGSQVLSLRSKSGHVELLRVPRTAEEYWQQPVLYGIPILFPPNRIERGTFTFEGRKYQFECNEPEGHNHIHGFVNGRPWELFDAREEDGRAEIITQFDSINHPEVSGQFPHRFRIKMRFLLEGSSLTKEAEIANLSDSSFPWGLGYHTTFNFPFRSGDSLAHCVLSATVDKRWVLNEQLLPTGELQDFPYHDQLNEGMNMDGLRLDDVFLSAASIGGQRNEAVLVDGNIGLKVVYRCDDRFKQWVLHNNDGRQGYLCPEPYTWVTNAPNLPVDRDLSGLQVLRPGESTTVRSSISVDMI
jgi:aldose 1-epimerase